MGNCNKTSKDLLRLKNIIILRELLEWYNKELNFIELDKKSLRKIRS